MRKVLALLMIPLPARLRRLLGNAVLGWEVDRTAHVGRSVVMVGKLVMGPGASIGAGNVIRHLDELRLGPGASIASRNWITGIPHAVDVFPTSPNRRPSLIMGTKAMITIGHEIDCADRVEIGDYAAVAGFNCVILTHSLNLVTDTFVASPVEIGARSAVMSGCTLASGVTVPARSIVSAGSVVNTPLTEELTFYRGNPAEAVRSLPPRMKYFRRGEPDHPASLL